MFNPETIDRKSVTGYVLARDYDLLLALYHTEIFARKNGTPVETKVKNKLRLRWPFEITKEKTNA